MQTLSFNSSQQANGGRRFSRKQMMVAGAIVLLVLYSGLAAWNYNRRMKTAIPKKIETQEDFDQASRALENRRLEVEKEAKEFGTKVE